MDTNQKSGFQNFSVLKRQKWSLSILTSLAILNLKTIGSIIDATFSDTKMVIL